MTLLGQNVNSYRWERGGKVDRLRGACSRHVASVDPLLRVRFATSHPKDLSDALLHAMAVASQHLPRHPPARPVGFDSRMLRTA